MPVDLAVFKDAAPYRGFKAEDWNILSASMKEKSVSAGGYVFKEGDPGDGFYFIRSGKVKISKQVVPEGKKSAQEHLLTVLTAGSLFGEMALVDGAPRSADAIAEEDSVLYYMPQAAYEKMEKDNPSTALRIQDLLVVTLCSRIRAVNRSFEIIRFWCT
ncbi:MAG TPA: cyclic nucleotide-binding domain-containing protein [bacterium]|nr:cyclic nucleotide-binding domain-containing protein [bacterium]